MSFCMIKRLKDAILRNIQVLGDAATNIPPEICLLHQDINWKYIIGMRNLITHRYFDGDMWILWNRGSSTTKTPIENNYRQIRSL